VSDAASGEPARSPRPVALTPPARVSIGTIEVTVVPPTPVPTVPAANALVNGTQAPARGGADVTLRAARGASRRWFGAGQS
jgi:hypothetical protein